MDKVRSFPVVFNSKFVATYNQVLNQREATAKAILSMVVAAAVATSEKKTHRD